MFLDCVLHGTLRQLELTRNRLHLVAPVRNECEQQMLGRDVFVLHRLRQFLGTSEHAHHVHPHAKTIRPAHARNGGKLLFEPCLEQRQINAADIKDGCEQPLRLLRECEQHMR